MVFEKLKKFFENSFGGNRIDNFDEIIHYLENNKLIFKDEVTNEYSVTVLGMNAAKCYLPPLLAANIGNFIRDLLTDDSSGSHIVNMTPIDYIILICLVSDELKPISRYMKNIELKIVNYMNKIINQKFKSFH